MITSPTGKGVILCGTVAHSNKSIFMELTGNSEDSIRWNKVEIESEPLYRNQIVIPITDEAWIKLTEDYWFQYKFHQFKSTLRNVFSNFF